MWLITVTIFHYLTIYRSMEGFDAIYYEEEIINNEDSVPGEVSLVPDPVVIRGAGNMTVYVKTLT